MKSQVAKASLEVGDTVRIVGKSSWKDSVGMVASVWNDSESVGVLLNGLRIGFGFKEVEPMPPQIPGKSFTINRFCRCLNGRRGTFTKGKSYKVKYLYQDGDGDFMVEVIDNFGWSVQAKAVRFAIATPALA